MYRVILIKICLSVSATPLLNWASWISNCFCTYLWPIEFPFPLPPPLRELTARSQLLGVSNEIIDRGEIKMDQVSLRRQKYEQESAYFLDSSATCTPVKVELGLIWSELSCRISNDPRSHHHFLFCAFAWKERERSETLPDGLVLWGWVQWKGNLN